jgi:hypothetical protein
MDKASAHRLSWHRSRGAACRAPTEDAKMNRASKVFAICVLVTACAHQEPAPAAKKDPTGDAVALAAKTGSSRTQKVCTTEMQVGSHFPITVCRSQEESDKVREQTQQSLRNAPQRTQGGNGN